MSRADDVAIATIAIFVAGCGDVAMMDAASAVDATRDERDVVVDRPRPFDLPRCTPGSRADCACVDGTAGEQLCGSDGAFEACECAAIDAGSEAAVPRDDGIFVDVVEPPRDAGPREACVPRTCASVSATCGILNDGCGSRVDCGTCGSITRAVPLTDVRHIAFDTVDGVLYATVGAMNAEYGSTLARLDPATGTVLSTIAAGVDPDVIALASDRSVLFVTLPFEHSVALIDPVTSAVWRRLPLPGEPQSLTVLPDSPQSFLVITTSSAPGTFEAIVFDGATQRLRATVTGQIAVGLAAGPIGFAYGAGVGGAAAHILHITPTTITDTSIDPLDGFASDPRPVVAGNDLVFGDGRTDDITNPGVPTARSRLLRHGTYAASGGANRLYVFGRRRDAFDTAATWGVYDRATNENLVEIDTGVNFDRAIDLVRTGPRRFAAVTIRFPVGTLHIIESPVQ